MTTDNDHISNLIARLLDKKHHFEQRVQEAEEAIHGLRRTQALLNDVYTFEAPEPQATKKGGPKLTYTVGAGFHKPDRIGQQTEDELVYSSSLPNGGRKE